MKLKTLNCNLKKWLSRFKSILRELKCLNIYYPKQKIAGQSAKFRGNNYKLSFNNYNKMISPSQIYYSNHDYS